MQQGRECCKWLEGFYNIVSVFTCHQMCLVSNQFSLWCLVLLTRENNLYDLLWKDRKPNFQQVSYKYILVSCLGYHSYLRHCSAVTGSRKNLGNNRLKRCQNTRMFQPGLAQRKLVAISTWKMKQPLTLCYRILKHLLEELLMPYRNDPIGQLIV